MSKHEQYEELCTLAMIGEVSPTEMQDLRQHLSECAECREHYREFTQFLLPQLSISSDNDASFETGYSTADRKRLRKDFLAAAQKKGHDFSREAIRGEAGGAQPFVLPSLPVQAPNFFFRYRWAVAASTAVALFAAGYGTRSVLVHRELASIHPAGSSVVASQSSDKSPVPGAVDATLVQLKEKDDADSKTIAGLQQKLAETMKALQDAQQSLHGYVATQTALQSQLNEKNGQIATLQSQTQGNEQGMNELRTQVAQLQQRVNEGQTTLVASERRIRDLNDQLATETASLGRERELLSAGRDVRDLMNARDLHIIDVHDADGVGKQRPSFGRIFYAEGKQLKFVAFDLDEKRVMNAGYSYEAWGERLGQPSSVKSLGILYVDDKTQRRWSLNVDDPRQLAEINSVFVTLEPHGGDGDKPKGKRILFAFLGGEPNHP